MAYLKLSEGFRVIESEHGPFIPDMSVEVDGPLFNMAENGNCMLHLDVFVFWRTGWFETREPSGEVAHAHLVGTASLTRYKGMYYYDGVLYKTVGVEHKRDRRAITAFVQRLATMPYRPRKPYKKQMPQMPARPKRFNVVKR